MRPSSPGSRPPRLPVAPHGPRRRALTRQDARAREEDWPMTVSPNEPAGRAAPSPARHRPLRRLGKALVSPDSYGSVLLLILFTYVFSVSVTEPWAASLVVTVQIATVWVALRVSQARRGVRRAAGLLLLISALGAAV